MSRTFIAQVDELGAISSFFYIFRRDICSRCAASSLSSARSLRHEDATSVQAWGTMGYHSGALSHQNSRACSVSGRLTPC